MGSAERREREKAELRQKILNAARELFVSHGLDNVTMRKIAEHIEYSPTAIYAHFPDKDSLLLAVCEHDFATLLNESAGIFEITDPIERLKQGAHFFIEFALRHPHQYQFMFMATGTGPGPSQAAVAAYNLCHDTMQQAIREQRIRAEYKDAQLVTQAFWAALHGVASMHIAGRFQGPIPAFDPRDVGAVVVEVALRGMLRPVANLTAPALKGKLNATVRGKRRNATRR